MTELDKVAHKCRVQESIVLQSSCADVCVWMEAPSKCLLHVQYTPDAQEARLPSLLLLLNKLFHLGTLLCLTSDAHEARRPPFVVLLISFLRLMLARSDAHAGASRSRCARVQATLKAVATVVEVVQTTIKCRSCAVKQILLLCCFAYNPEQRHL